jgi:osomolarity two-component system sensor histidine kinase TcsA
LEHNFTSRHQIRNFATPGMSDLDANDIWDLFPVPTLVLSPSCCIQRVSNSLLDAWKRQRGELVGRDLFAALYGNSQLERFDRIPLTRAIEVAVAARQLRLCYAAYTAHEASWSARIIPIFRKDELILLVLEWELVEADIGATGIELTQSLLSVDEMFRLLIQTVKDYAIFLLDTRGYVATWNTGAELLKGYKKGDIVGKHFSTFYGENDLQSGKPEKELETCLREGRVQDEGWRYRKDGSRFWASVVITAVHRNGVHVGFGKVTRDLTERRESEVRLIAAYEQSAKLKNDFLANMSHEIRTPMHGMLSACALLLDTPLAENQREMANLISESGQVLLQVINDILDYSKIASGNVVIKPGLLDIASIISSVSRSVQVTLRAGVHLKFNLSAELPKVARGDSLRFRQIIQNIVDNAAKFTEEGCIWVQASVLTEDETTYTILTSVSDTGIGVTDAAAQRLFKPFTQLEPSANKRFQGTGLGLSIAKSLTELMGGQIGYRPNPERKGTVFWFSVKLEKIVNLEQHNSVERRPDEGAEETHQGSRYENDAVVLKQLQEIAPKKRLLAAEDNVINQKVLVRMLRSFGFTQIDMAYDGAQAVSMLKSSPDKYQLVMMDVSMPVMDGFEATHKIRSSGINVPILAMTAYALTGDMETCLEKGMDDYISKPMDRNMLQQKLLRWLDGSNQFDATADGVAAPRNVLPLRVTRELV